MSQYPMKLDVACEVCGLYEIVLVAPVSGDAQGTYMCGHCKAVFYPSGKRNPSYASIYDGPKPAFDAAHTQALAGAAGKPTDMRHERLATVGLKPDEPVQVFVDDGWEYGNAKDYDPAVAAMQAAVPGHGLMWYRHWQSAEQSQPLPVAAPASPRTLPQVLRRAKGKATPAEPSATVRVYTTLHLDEVSHRGVVYTLLPRKDMWERELLVGKDAVPLTILLYFDVPRSQFLAFDKESGGMLAVARTAGTARRKAKNAFKDMTRRMVTATIRAAVKQGKSGEMLTPERFLKMKFV